MANIHFSFSDSLQAAVSSCLCCFQSSDPERDPAQDNDSSRNALISTMPPPRARPDELEGLLADSDSADAETLSLHSNLGDERRRRKRRRPRKGIKLFGFDLFGRPPIHLPESDDEDYGHGRRTRTISSSTLDSDAAPLDASVLDEASVARLAAATAAAEEEQRRAKEERRRLRRERKELKRMALAMAMGMHASADQGEFEGFPVSVSLLYLLWILSWRTVPRGRPTSTTIPFILWSWFRHGLRLDVGNELAVRGGVRCF